MKISKLALLSVAALLASVPALADSFTVSLLPANPTVAAGSTYTLSGTITAAAGNTGDIFPLGDTITVDAPVTYDDTLFLVNVPLSLAAGQSFTGDLFTVTLPSSIATGVYLGNLDVLSSDALGNFITADAAFSVNATQASSVTPEPGSWLLLSTGLGAAGVLRRRFATR